MLRCAPLGSSRHASPGQAGIVGIRDPSPVHTHALMRCLAIPSLRRPHAAQTPETQFRNRGRRPPQHRI
eukprot:7848083-Alexandrium_andersonii.AAC.1